MKRRSALRVLENAEHQRERGCSAASRNIRVAYALGRPARARPSMPRASRRIRPPAMAASGSRPSETARSTPCCARPAAGTRKMPNGRSSRSPSPICSPTFERRCAERTVKDSWPRRLGGDLRGDPAARRIPREGPPCLRDARMPGDWIVISAITSKHAAGFVEVVATLGGKRVAGNRGAPLPRSIGRISRRPLRFRHRSRSTRRSMTAHPISSAGDQGGRRELLSRSLSSPPPHGGGAAPDAAPIEYDRPADHAEDDRADPVARAQTNRLSPWQVAGSGGLPRAVSDATGGAHSRAPTGDRCIVAKARAAGSGDRGGCARASALGRGGRCDALARHDQHDSGPAPHGRGVTDGAECRNIDRHGEPLSTSCCVGPTNLGRQRSASSRSMPVSTPIERPSRAGRPHRGLCTQRRGTGGSSWSSGPAESVKAPAAAA